LAVRHGPRLHHLQAWSKPDPRGEVIAALAPFQARIASLQVDSAGLGHYFARHLEDHGYRGKVQDVNVGESASDSDKYANLKAELYWGLRMRFAEGAMSGIMDDVLISQLAGIRYSHNARGQVVIERKEEARKRGVKSPDRAEAVMLAYAKRRKRRGGVW
jgi:phage terminase large subunit